MALAYASLVFTLLATSVDDKYGLISVDVIGSAFNNVTV